MQRRTTLKSLGWLVAAGASAGSRQLFAQGPASGTPADQWRALSRLGYGLTPALLESIQAAGNPRAWSLQQLDVAYQTSKTPPFIAPDLADINLPLPQIFEGAARERQARAAIKAGAKPATEGDTDPGRRFDFSGTPDAMYFNRVMIQKTTAWRLHISSSPELENPLLARMTEFWFNHLNVYIGKGPVRPFVGHYVINVARAHALGKFEDLLLASARHPAMLFYLDQWQSVAQGTRGPQGNARGLNENYARELMELHTLGVDGGYTQTDVRELARVLTGWTVGPQDSSGFRFVQRMHDNDRKTVMGKTYPDGFFGGGVNEGEQAIRMLARHPATAQRIALRLAEFFVADAPSPALVQQLKQTFLQSGGDLREVMRTLIASPDFWNPENRLFKTPLDFALSALTATQSAGERKNLLLTAGFLNNAGQPLHGWQTPDGYKTDAATWLAPEALTRRADYAMTLGRQSAGLEFLKPYMSNTTVSAIAQERPVLQAGLMLASPDFMYK